MPAESGIGVRARARAPCCLAGVRKYSVSCCLRVVLFVLGGTVFLTPEQGPLSHKEKNLSLWWLSGYNLPTGFRWK